MRKLRKLLRNYFNRYLDIISMSVDLLIFLELFEHPKKKRKRSLGNTSSMDVQVVIV